MSIKIIERLVSLETDSMPGLEKARHMVSDQWETTEISAESKYLFFIVKIMKFTCITLRRHILVPHLWQMYCHRGPGIKRQFEEHKKNNVWVSTSIQHIYLLLINTAYTNPLATNNAASDWDFLLFQTVRVANNKLW